MSAARHWGCPSPTERPWLPSVTSVVQSDIERRALADRPLRPDSPTMPEDDASHSRESDAGAFVLLDAVQTLERSEQFMRVRHLEACAVIPDKKHPVTVLLGGIHF